MAKKKSPTGRKSTNFFVTATCILLLNIMIAGIMKLVRVVSADTDCQKTLSSILANLSSFQDGSRGDSNIIILNASGPNALTPPFDSVGLPKGVRVSLFYHRRSSLAGMPVKLSRVEVSHSATQRIYRFLSVNSVSLQQIIDPSSRDT